MFRLPITAALLAAATVFAPFALADELSYGSGPAVTLIRNGIAGSGNQLEKAPAVAVIVDKLAFVPGKTTFKELDDVLGIEQYTLGEGGDAFTWACVVSPAATDSPALLIWFGKNWTAEAKNPVDAFAYEAEPTDIPPGCFMSETPLTVTTGVPGLGATQAELEAAFGPKPNMEADGTVAYMFGSVPAGDGINVITQELKYRVIDGKVVAVKFGVVNEME
jgi:hypothetical protein